METLISTNEKIKTSAIYVGYLVLKQLKKSTEGKISIYDIAEYLKEKYNITHYSQILYGLIFLHTCGVIDFKEPYIYRINDKN